MLDRYHPEKSAHGTVQQIQALEEAIHSYSKLQGSIPYSEVNVNGIPLLATSLPFEHCPNEPSCRTLHAGLHARCRPESHELRITNASRRVVKRRGWCELLSSNLTTCWNIQVRSERMFSLSHICECHTQITRSIQTHVHEKPVSSCVSGYRARSWRSAVVLWQAMFGNDQSRKINCAQLTFISGSSQGFAPFTAFSVETMESR